jgi:hypothetical protein
VLKKIPGIHTFLTDVSQWDSSWEGKEATSQVLQEKIPCDDQIQNCRTPVAASECNRKAIEKQQWPPHKDYVPGSHSLELPNSTEKSNLSRCGREADNVKTQKLSVGSSHLLWLSHTVHQIKSVNSQLQCQKSHMTLT